MQANYKADAKAKAEHTAKPEADTEAQAISG